MMMQHQREWNDYNSQRQEQALYAQQRLYHNSMLEQQKYMRWQMQKEYTEQADREKNKQRLAELSKMRDRIESNTELDPNYQSNLLNEITQEEDKIRTGMDINAPQIFTRPSGYNDAEGNDIPIKYYYGPDGKIEDLNEPHKRAVHEQNVTNQDRTHEQNVTNQAAVNVMERDKINNTKFANDTARKAADAKAAGIISGEATQKEKETLLKEMKARNKEARARSANQYVLRKHKEWEEDNKDDSGAVKPLPSGMEKQWQVEGEEAALIEHPEKIPIPDLNEEYENRRLLRKSPEELSDDEARKSVRYEQPETLSPEFSEEQFAGLYAPSGSPLGMDDSGSYLAG